MAATAEPPPPPPPAKPFLGLLNGIAQATYYGNAEITEELLRDQLYPETASQEFRVLLAKMTGIVKSVASADMDSNQLEAFLTAQTKKPGGITTDQAAVIAKFWKNHRVKIRESLINQSKWENSLKNLSWRVDLKSESRHISQLNSPVAIVEMELGKNEQDRSRREMWSRVLAAVDRPGPKMASPEQPTIPTPVLPSTSKMGEAAVDAWSGCQCSVLVSLERIQNSAPFYTCSWSVF